jgi:lipoyl(octanoyl) transferase
LSYNDALVLQERMIADVRAGAAEETLLLLEHPPVYTMGRSGSNGSILDPAIQVERINRGGDVTYHGPGQLVGYPIINLGRRGKDLRQYLRFLEELIIQVGRRIGRRVISRSAGRTGVWTEPR